LLLVVVLMSTRINGLASSTGIPGLLQIGQGEL
jgi:hypothetical protein